VKGYRPIRILFVDDNLDDVEIARRAFDKSPVASELHIVRDGEEALDFLFRRGAYGDSARSPRPDLILLDLNLPKLTGIEVLERIRASDETSSIPVVMVSASNRDEDAVKSYELGVNTYLQKPVVFARFAHALEVLGEYWTGVAKLPPTAA